MRPEFKGQMELRRETPRSARTYHIIFSRMKQLIDQDEEKLQRIQAIPKRARTPERNTSGLRRSKLFPREHKLRGEIPQASAGPSYLKENI